MNTIKVPKLVFKIEEVDFLSIKNKWAKEQSAPESKTPVVTKVPKIVSKKEQSRNIKAQDARVADYTAHENSVEGLRKMGPPTPTKDASFSVPQMDSTPKAITHQDRASVEIPEHIKANQQIHWISGDFWIQGIKQHISKGDWQTILSLGAPGRRLLIESSVPTSSTKSSNDVAEKDYVGRA